MTARPAPAHSGGFLAAVRRQERSLAVAWLAATLLLLGALAAQPVRARVLHLAQAAVDRWESRWTTRLEQGQALVAAGRFAEAAPFLERLDREFPARTVRHARDKERERLLRLLAQAYEGEGRRGRAMATWSRLEAFDSLNYANHFSYAQAAERLLSGWAIAPEARDGYARVLDIFPSHYPSVRGYLRYYLDRGDFRPVVAGWERYLDAWFVQPVDVSLGDTTITLKLPVDGRSHAVIIRPLRPLAGATRLVIVPQGFAVRVDEVVLQPALAVGRAAAPPPRRLDLASMEPRERGESGAWLPPSFDASLTLPVPPDLGPVAEIRLGITLFKPADGRTWAAVAKSYQNLLDYQGLARARARTVPFADAAAADSVIARQPFASEGLSPSLHD